MLTGGPLPASSRCFKKYLPCLAGYGADPIRARLDIAGDLRTQLDDHRVDLVSWAELGQRHWQFDRFDVGPARSTGYLPGRRNDLPRTDRVVPAQKLQCESGQPALGSSRSSLRTPA